MFGIKVKDKTVITLPSNGFIEGVPKEVSISPLTGRHEIKLNTMSLSSYMDFIISDCVKNLDGSDINIEILSPADKTYITHMIRSITYSDEYVSEYICRNPECSRIVHPVVKLSELEVHKLSKDPLTILSSIDLGDDIIVTLKLLSDSELTALEFEAKQMSNKLKNTRLPEECYNLLYLMRSIKEFSYIVDETKEIKVVDAVAPEGRPLTQQLIEALPADRISIIRNALAEANNFGVELAKYHKCENCGTINYATVSVNTTEFFRPSNTR